jgi:O-acetylhomoserine (thiol)-lyase
MSDFREYRFETQALHAGQAPDPATGSRAVPIYQTTSFVFDSAQHAASLFNLDEAGPIYTRIGNPTLEVLEKRIAYLEGGIAGVATASGQAALSLIVMNLCGPGDEIVAANNLYGGSSTLLGHTLAGFGIKTTFVDASDPENIRAAITERTRMIYGETIGNPRLNVLDIEKVAEIAHAHGIPLVLDNTFATPYICRPIEWGADIVMHSATKWLGGHGTSIGGMVVDSGRFEWGNGKFAKLVDPDPSYQGISYWRDFGTLAFITKLRVHLMRDMGPCMSPFNAFLILQGVETLHVRMERHCRNALELARWLSNHPAVAWIRYPGLESDPANKLARKYLGHGLAGAVVVFGIKGGLEAGRSVINNVALWSHLANVGDAKSLIIHPASTTHQQLSSAQRAASGVGDDLIRLAVGIENIEDLKADLGRALNLSLGKVEEEVLLNDEETIKGVVASSFSASNGKAKTIAVVGLSPDPSRPSFRTARKLKRLGYRIVAINPKASEVLEEKAYPTLEALPETPDVVLVFRAAEAAPQIARETVAKGARVFWLQEGISSPEAVEIASQAGIHPVMNRCIYKEIQRVRGHLPAFRP